MAARDDEKSPYWFPAKRYGWGWGAPIVWQGWAALMLWIALFAVAVVVFPLSQSPIAFVASILVITVLFSLLCWLKGEPPRWRWGDKD